MAATIDQLIINAPYEEPQRHGHHPPPDPLTLVDLVRLA